MAVQFTTNILTDMTKTIHSSVKWKQSGESHKEDLFGHVIGSKCVICYIWYFGKSKVSTLSYKSARPDS